MLLYCVFSKKPLCYYNITVDLATVIHREFQASIILRLPSAILLHSIAIGSSDLPGKICFTLCKLAPKRCHWFLIVFINNSR